MPPTRHFVIGTVDLNSGWLFMRAKKHSQSTVISRAWVRTVLVRAAPPCMVSVMTFPIEVERVTEIQGAYYAPRCRTLLPMSC